MLRRNRDPDSCDIQIRLPEVSKRQAKIESDNEDKAREHHTLTAPAQSPARASIHHSTVALPQVWIANMSKTNPGGTILNNEPLQEDERRELNNNDIVQICGRRFLFTCGEPSVPTQTPPTAHSPGAQTALSHQT